MTSHLHLRNKSSPTIKTMRWLNRPFAQGQQKKKPSATGMSFVAVCSMFFFCITIFISAIGAINDVGSFYQAIGGRSVASMATLAIASGILLTARRKSELHLFPKWLSFLAIANIALSLYCIPQILRAITDRSPVAATQPVNSNVNLRGQDLSNIRYDSANLRAAQMTNTKFSNSTFEGSNLSEADLRNAIFDNVDFSAVNLCGADIRGADLRHAKGSVASR